MGKVVALRISLSVLVDADGMYMIEGLRAVRC